MGTPPQTQRIEFTPAQINSIFHSNWMERVWKRWPDMSQYAPRVPHYICEECGFVSPVRQHFQVDHVVPCARGGTNDPWNAQLLCFGCNQSKKAWQFVWPGAGWAYAKHDLDRNPDHLYAGPPKVSVRELAEFPEMRVGARLVSIRNR